MTVVAEVPEWVAPPAVQVSDLYWLARAAVADGGPPWAGGVESGAGWLWSGAAPVTGRRERPVTKGLAEAEKWAAATAGPSRDVPPPVEWLGPTYGYPVAHPLPVNPGWARGAHDTLAWLLGLTSRPCPLELPARGPDGAVLSAEQRFDQQMVQRPWTLELGEQRAEFRLTSARSEARDRRLAALIDATRRTG